MEKLLLLEAVNLEPESRRMESGSRKILKTYWCLSRTEGKCYGEVADTFDWQAKPKALTSGNCVMTSVVLYIFAWHGKSNIVLKRSLTFSSDNPAVLLASTIS